jgi:hypothetical protein
LRFQASPGTDVKIRLQIQGQSATLDGDVLIIPEWKRNVKDSIVGTDLSEEFETVSVCCTAVGTVALTVGICLAIMSIISKRRAAHRDEMERI